MPDAMPAAAGGPSAGEPLPAPVRRWLEVAWRDEPAALDTLVLQGPGRVRPGPMPWLPVDVRMHHRLGLDHVADLRCRVRGRTLFRAVEAIVGGTGVSRAGPFRSVGPGVDQAAFLLQWSMELLYPCAWSRLPGLRWVAAGADAAIALLPFREGIEEARIGFDPATGQVATFEAARCRGARGPRTPWRVTYGGWRRLAGLPVPAAVTIGWLDEPRPRVEMRVERVYPDVPIDDVLAEARPGGGVVRR